MLLKVLRNALGYAIVFGSWLTKPKPIQRTAEQQAKVQENLQGHSLYQLFACPFCVKTRRALRRLNIAMDIQDINKNQHARIALKEDGGKVQVPSLRIEENNEVRWIYESKDIIRYLEQRVNAA